jgi:hypothetical protein
MVLSATSFGCSDHLSLRIRCVCVAYRIIINPNDGNIGLPLVNSFEKMDWMDPKNSLLSNSESVSGGSNPPPLVTSRWQKASGFSLSGVDTNEDELELPGRSTR